MTAQTPVAAPTKGLSLPPMGAPMLEVRNLSKVYRVGESRLAALNRVTLSIPRGSFTAVVGTSGSGKSTLLNMVAGLERPTAGEIYVGGRALHTMNESQLVTFRRDHVGFIFQSFNLMPHLTALQNVALPLSFRGVPKAARLRRAHIVLNQMGLAKHVNHKPTQLSGGQQQRVAIARALMNDPLFLLADEATGNLDSNTEQEILALFDDLRRDGVTIVIVTHNQKVADRAEFTLWLKDGRVERLDDNRAAAEARP